MKRTDFLFVWDVCQLSSAASAGIIRGDIILAVDGTPVEKINGEFSRESQVGAIFGTGEDSVTLTIWQGPDLVPVDFTLPLGSIGNCPYRYYFIVFAKPRIAYIRVPDFKGDTEAYLLRTLSIIEENALQHCDKNYENDNITKLKSLYTDLVHVESYLDEKISDLQQKKIHVGFQMTDMDVDKLADYLYMNVKRYSADEMDGYEE